MARADLARDSGVNINRRRAAATSRTTRLLEGAPRRRRLTGSDHEKWRGSMGKDLASPGVCVRGVAAAAMAAVLLSWRALVPTPAQYSATSTRLSGKKKKPAHAV